jgi:two-component system, NarL family, sensor histidine kinase DesK
MSVTDVDQTPDSSARFAPRNAFAHSLVVQNPFGVRRRRLVFPAIWLVYLLQTASDVHDRSHGAWAVVGYATLVLFAVCYVVALPARWNGNDRRFWLMYGAMLVLTAVEIPLAHEGAFVMFIYIAVLGLATAARWALPVAGAFALLSLVLPPVIKPWHAGLDATTALSLGLVSLAMWAFFGIIHTNNALEEARAEVAVLAAEGERNRIARDLHDLLGHSLTTITVKAGLAKRLAEHDPARAAIEIGEVEELARRSLTDVRAAVSNYRIVTLASELATAQEVLRATGIDALVLTPTEVVDGDLQELFGWVVREGTTNVVRHAHATRCTITLAPRSIEITDDGDGAAKCGNEFFGASAGTASAGTTNSGTGIKGLRERLESVGGTVEVGAAPGGGWRLAAAVP